jgi:hypothetical protein
LLSGFVRPTRGKIFSMAKKLLICPIIKSLVKG